MALSKVDALDPATRKARAAALKKAAKAQVRLVSGVSGEGVTELLREAWALVRARRAEVAGSEGLPAESEGWTP